MIIRELEKLRKLLEKQGIYPLTRNSGWRGSRGTQKVLNTLFNDL
ncbi:hypothetical protein UF75_2443 [Desulfosporosinus sp. I2]|nr:hypothetical protein UF75_2443 [Desulfosporosinus sp. I2]